MSKKIAFVGLGNMGGPMAANLVKAGHVVNGFDLEEPARATAIKAGVTVASSGSAAISGADILITMLPAGKHVIGVWQDLVPRLSKGALAIDCSTIDVANARAAHEIARVAGCLSLDAPVSGGIAGAAGATLTFMVGGAQAAFGSGKAILENMGKRVVHCGEVRVHAYIPVNHSHVPRGCHLCLFAVAKRVSVEFPLVRQLRRGRETASEPHDCGEA